jgi:hypothetical protein
MAVGEAFSIAHLTTVAIIDCTEIGALPFVRQKIARISPPKGISQHGIVWNETVYALFGDFVKCERIKNPAQKAGIVFGGTQW